MDGILCIRGTLLNMIGLEFHYKVRTISVSHSIAVKLSNCSTISPGNIDAHFFYSLTGLSFSRNTVAALSSPSSGKLCFNLMNDGSSWDCEQARWTQDPQRPALYIFDNYNKYYDSI